jgi:glyoxylase-like metal-dependent hydrolase (beta-lactamase superfamily II)
MSVPESPHFRLAEVGPGVWAALAGSTGACVSNAAIVDLGDRTLVFDCFQTIRAAEDLRAAAGSLTGRSAFLTLISHWHSDHIGGAQVFDDAPIRATARTCELVAGKDPGDLDAYSASIDAALARGRERIAKATTDADRAAARNSLHAWEMLKEEAPGFRYTVPAPLEDDGMTVAGSERTVEVVSYGPGHTESDLFLHVPDADVVITGDLLWVGQHPRAVDGDPGAWAETLGRIGGLGPRSLVSGHGPVGTAADAAHLAGYLRTLDSMIDEAVVAGLDDAALASLPFPEGSEDWTGVHRFHGSLIGLASRRKD